MNKHQSTIKCPLPNCNGEIQIEMFSLISGMKFTCGICNSAIGLANESKEVVTTVYNEFLKVKS